MAMATVPRIQIILLLSDHTNAANKVCNDDFHFLIMHHPLAIQTIATYTSTFDPPKDPTPDPLGFTNKRV